MKSCYSCRGGTSSMLMFTDLDQEFRKVWFGCNSVHVDKQWGFARCYISSPQSPMPHRCIVQHFQHLTAFPALDRVYWCGIVGLHEAGRSYCPVAWHVGHTDIEVADAGTCGNMMALTNGMKVQVSQDRTQHREDHYIVCQALQNPVTSAPAILAQVLDSSAMNPSSALPQRPSCARMATARGKDWSCQCCGETQWCYFQHHSVGSHRVWLQVTSGSDSQTLTAQCFETSWVHKPYSSLDSTLVQSMLRSTLRSSRGQPVPLIFPQWTFVGLAWTQTQCRCAGSWGRLCTVLFCCMCSGSSGPAHPTDMGPVVCCTANYAGSDNQNKYLSSSQEFYD